QLAGTEELFDRGRNGLGVDQIVRHEVFSLCLTQTFFNGAFYTYQSCAELVLGQLAHTTHTAIAQVIDVIDLATAVTQLNQDLDGFKYVFVGQCHGAGDIVATTQAAVYLHAAHARQFASVFAVEQALEQRLDGVLGRRLTGAHHAVNGYASGHLVSSFIGAQRLRNIAATIQVVNVQGLDFTDIGGADFGQYGLIDFVVGVGNDFTR